MIYNYLFLLQLRRFSPFYLYLKRMNTNMVSPGWSKQLFPFDSLIEQAYIIVIIGCSSCVQGSHNPEKLFKILDKN